jgi:hypothetical protein
MQKVQKFKGGSEASRRKGCSVSDTKSLAIVPRTFVDIQTMAETFSKSALLPDALKGKVPDLVFQIMAGAELGLAPVASIRGIHIIQGKPTLASDTMMALCLSSGLCEYFTQIEATATSVTFETKRKGSPHPQRCTWTMEDAKRAALHQKDTWRAHPRQMLASRAKAELARSAYPDVLAGCFDPDEIAVPARPVDHVKADVQDAEFVEVAPAPEFDPSEYEEFAELAAAATVQQCKLIAPKFAKRGLEAGHPAFEAFKEKYAARVKWIKSQPFPTSSAGASGSAVATSSGSAPPSSASGDEPEAE